MSEPLAVGDFVARKSYDTDVIFKVVAVEGDSVLLRGVLLRIMADAPVSDLVRIEPERALLALRSLELFERKIG